MFDLDEATLRLWWGIHVTDQEAAARRMLERMVASQPPTLIQRLLTTRRPEQAEHDKAGGC